MLDLTTREEEIEQLIFPANLLFDSDERNKWFKQFAMTYGFDSEEYLALIEKAAKAETAEDRAAALHEAEEMLLEEMPICPLVTLQSAYIKSKLLSGFDTDYYGVTDFKRVKMKNYMDYKPDEDAEETNNNAEE